MSTDTGSHDNINRTTAIKLEGSTIGNVGTSTNTITGAANTITGTTSSSMRGANAEMSLASNSARMGVARHRWFVLGDEYFGNDARRRQ